MRETGADERREGTVSTLCKNCSNRIYLGNYLGKPTWVHHGSNYIPCYGGLDTVAEPAEPTSGEPPQTLRCKKCGESLFPEYGHCEKHGGAHEPDLAASASECVK